MKARVNPALVVFLALAVAALAGSCGADEEASESSPSGETGQGGMTSRGEEARTSGGALTPAEATIGPEEGSSMMPAGGEEPDPAQRPPENPPEGVRTFPATTNDLVEGDVDYEQTPPANGDHDPLWQNCGFYEEPVRDENAVHSLDHGAVWITYDPELSRQQVEALRSFSDEEYVLVSPYPDQPASVIATAWRNQLRLDAAGDPRLSRFVEQFLVSQTAPLSGNGCTGGVGDPG